MIRKIPSGKEMERMLRTSETQGPQTKLTRDERLASRMSRDASRLRRDVVF